MPEIANLAADLEQSVYSAEISERAYTSDLTDSSRLAAFTQATYSADLSSSDLP